MPEKKTLDYYVTELRRVEESRQKNSEKEIKKIYKEILKELNSFISNEYVKYSNKDGNLSVAILQEKSRYAKFLQEVEQNLNSVTPKISKAIKGTVEDTYKAVYTGMIKAVKDCSNNEELNKKLKGLDLRPEVMKRAIENPISGLTLPDILEKHRKEVIYNIKQQINIGLMTGERYDTMSKNINKVISGDNGTSGCYGKAINIARTECHRVQESGLMDCAEDIAENINDDNLIYAATWRTMKDQRVRPQVRIHTSKGWKTKTSKTKADHQKMEGVTIKVGEQFEIEKGVFTKSPGNSGTARNDINCRCFIEYDLMSVEEFAKATGQTVEEIKKKYNFRDNRFTNANDSGIINSGAISGALDPDSEKADEHAERYYASVRKMKTDFKRIAKNTGYDSATIKSIKDFIFIDKHYLRDGSFRRFDPSYEMSQSWQRLIDGKNIQPHDLTLIKHEVMERDLMKTGLSQNEAHIITSEKYNYKEESERYYADIKKNKKR